MKIRLLGLVYSMLFPLILLAGNNEASISLNGKWDFGLARKYTETTLVPSIPLDPSKVISEKLWYKRVIKLPAGSWTYATLELKGARFSPEIFINGISVSKANGGMAPTFHYLKNDAVKPGATITIEIALKSLKDIDPSDASFIPPADQWRSNISSGLWDDVVLHLHGNARIDRIVPFVDFKSHDATIRYDLTRFDDKTKLSALLEILDNKGRVVISKSSPVNGLKSSVLFNYQNKLENWSPEKPNLYQLRLTITDAGKKLVDQSVTPFGIKQFEIRNKQFYLNDEPLKIRGGTIVWHRWMRSAEGRELGFDTTWFKQNIVQRLKDHGANYLRFHLGKPPERFLDLCDKYGLVVQYEWSFFHGMPATRESLLEQYDNWLDVAMRHPSVAIYHPYNETEGAQLDIVWDALDTILKDYPPLVMEERDVIHVHKYWWSLFENLGLYYDDANQFEKAIMVDEFGGNYLDEKGDLGGYKALKESYLRFMGRKNSAEERLKFHSESHSKIAEYWRRIGAAGFAPFCILSSWEDGNTWFMGKLSEGNPKPVWNALTASFSPKSISLDLWDKNFTPSQSVDIPLHLFNDLKTAEKFAVKISVENEEGIALTKTIDADVNPFSKAIVNVSLVMPSKEGVYKVSAQLLNKPQEIKYRVISHWDIRVLKTSVPEGLKKVKIAIPDNEPELKKFLEESGISSQSISKSRSVDLIITSSKSWQQISKGDSHLNALFEKAIQKGTSIVMLDVGPKNLGQGYPSKAGELGPLQGVVRITNPKIDSYNLFGGIDLQFTEAAEPESYLHPDKNNNALWRNISEDYTRIFNGTRGGLIVPASDMAFSGLNSKAFITQWVGRGAVEKEIIKGPYYAYELQGFYEFSSKPDDADLQKSLKAKVQFLVEDAPALANAINPQTPVVITDLAKSYQISYTGNAEDFIPLANCGKNLTRTPVALIDFGKNKGRLLVSQLLTANRLSKDFEEKGLYGIRYDPVAVQYVLNMLDLSLKGKTINNEQKL